MKVCPTCGREWPDDVLFCADDGTPLRVFLSDADDLVGTVVADRYRIKKQLGQGGMGAVYLGEHVRIGKEVAIKVISRQLASDSEAIVRFTREARNAARIEHPNVCAIHDFGETADGLMYLAMEYVKGESLANLLRREGRLTVQHAAAIVVQCSHALQAAHDLDIVHRDIKPHNIMVSTDRDGADVVKVVDFGIAKAVAGDAGTTITKTGFVVGTPQYLSPEQASGGPLDGRSDTYSLALVYFEMLTGTLPFKGETVQEIILQRITTEPMTLLEAWPDRNLADRLQPVFDRALARDREQRYNTVLEFGRVVAELTKEPAPGSASVVHAGEAPTKLLSFESQATSTAPPRRTPSGTATPETPQPSVIAPTLAYTTRWTRLAILGAAGIIGVIAVQTWPDPSGDGGPFPSAASLPTEQANSLMTSQDGSALGQRGTESTPDSSRANGSGGPEGATTNVPVRTLQGILGASHIAFTSDGRLVAAGGSTSVQIWEVATGRGHSILRTVASIRSFGFSPDNRYIAGIGEFGLRIWDVVSGLGIRTVTMSTTPKSFAFSPDGRIVAASTGTATDQSGTEVILWNIGTGERIRNLGSVWRPGQPINSFAFSPDGQSVALSAGFGWRAGLALLPLAVDQARSRVLSRGVQIAGVLFSPDGGLLAGGGEDAILLWDVESGEEIRNFPSDWASFGFSPLFALSPDGQLLADVAGSSVHLWEIATGQKIRTLDSPLDCCIDYLTFGPVGEFLASRHTSGRDSSNVRLWNVATGRELQSFKGAQAVAFEPGGRSLAIGIRDSTGVQLWPLNASESTSPGSGSAVRTGGRNK